MSAPVLPGANIPTSGAIQIVSMVLTFLTTIGVAWIGYLTATAKARAEVAAKNLEAAQQRNTAAVKTVTSTLAATAAATKQALVATNGVTLHQLDALTNVAKATHVLVNSNYGQSLLSTLNALKAVRRLTHDPADIRAADEAVAVAQRLYDDHIAKQANVDATNPVGPFPSTNEKPQPINPEAVPP